MIRTGMLRAWGPGLRRALTLGTSNRLFACAAGLVVAALVQSSTATTLLVSSFAANQLLSGTAALAIVLGADVGTTLAVQILSVTSSAAFGLLIAAGVFMFFGIGSDRMRSIGRILIGLGLIFLSLKLIGEASAPLRAGSAMPLLLAPLATAPALAVLVGAVLAFASYSSLAIVLLVMSFAMHNVVPVGTALALVLGANLGGALNPLVAQSAAAPAARRVPLGNFAMRLAGVIVALPLLAPIQSLLSGIEAEPARLTVNFHTAFNLAIALVFLPLVPLVAKFCARILPDRPMPDDVGKPRYLDGAVLDSPSEALACAARETLRLGDLVAGMLRSTMEVFHTDDSRQIKHIEHQDDAVDRLHEAIKLYLMKLSKTEMSAEESRRYVEILTFTINLEHIGDIIDKNLMELATKKRKHRYTFSAEGLTELKAFHGRVMTNMGLAFNVFMASDPKLARRLLAEKTMVRDAELAAAQSHFDRLREGRPESIETSAIHMDIIRDLKRINSHFTSVAYPILEAAGELADSRLRGAGANGLAQTPPQAG